MNEGSKTIGVEFPRHDKSDIEMASDRIGEKSEDTARLIEHLKNRLEAVLMPLGAPNAPTVGGACGTGPQWSPLEHKLASHSDFIYQSNLKLQDLIDRLAV